MKKKFSPVWSYNSLGTATNKFLQTIYQKAAALQLPIW